MVSEQCIKPWVQKYVGHSCCVTNNLECMNFFLHFILYAYKGCMAKLMCVIYKKVLLHATNIHIKFCTLALNTLFYFVCNHKN